MNVLLSKHRPKNLDAKQWEAQWEAASSVLQPLANALLDIQRGLGKVKHDDFSCPNHYAQLVCELAKSQIIDQILDLMPNSVEKH